MQHGDRRAQCRPAARAPDRVPRRRPSGRRGRGERRRPDGRRRQYRRPPRRHRQARRHLLSEDAYRQVKGRLDLPSAISATTNSKTSPSRSGSIRSRSAAAPRPASPLQPPPPRENPAPRGSRSSSFRSPAWAGGPSTSSSTGSRRASRPTWRESPIVHRRPQHRLHLQGKPVDAKQVGRELNVRYILEGSIQRCGAPDAVNVQLIDALTGNHLWAGRFDKPMADCSTCRTRSSRSSPTSCVRNCSPPRLDAPRARKIPIRSTLSSGHSGFQQGRDSKA